MSGVHKDKMQFNPQVEQAVGLLIKRRADAAFAGSSAACVAAIIEFWIGLGCPPLNDAELGLLAIGKLPGVQSGKSHPRNKIAGHVVHAAQDGHEK